MEENVQELCRLCAGFEPVKIPIFSIEGQQRNLVDKIQTCLQFRVTEEDGFPSSICYKCLFNLDNFFDFYEKSLRAQSALNSKIVEAEAELVMTSMTRLVNKDEQQTDASSLPLQQAVYRPFPCDLCTTSFMSIRDRWTHVALNHKGDARITCIFCLKGFSTITNLNFHKKHKHDKWEKKPRPLPKLQKITKNKTYEIVRNKTETMLQDARFGQDRFIIDRLKNLGVEISIGNVLNNQLGYEDNFQNPGDLLELALEDGENLESIQLESVFGCEVCLRHFKDGSSLWLHMLYLHKNEAGYTCGMCLKLCNGFQQLQQHINLCKEMNESEKRRYYCNICYRQHESKKKLETHTMIHNLADPWLAQNMDLTNLISSNPTATEKTKMEEAMDNTQLRQDQLAYQNILQSSGHFLESSAFFDPEPEMKLESGGEMTANVGFEKHRSNAHKSGRKMMAVGESASSVDCEICGKRLTSKTERWKHCFKEHAEDSRLICSSIDCGKVMATESLNKKHETFHEQQGKFPICCEICAKLWFNKIEFWKHVSGVHYSLIGLTCGVCMKMFLHVDQLKKHVKRHEPLSEAEFNCDICGRGYLTKSKMTRHRLIHEHNILKQTLLNNFAKVSQNFDNEMMEVIEINSNDGAHEEGVPDYLWCNECPDMRFADLDQLRMHRRSIHALYPCDICHKFFGGVSLLWKHTNRSHKNHPDITCKICGKTSASRVQLHGHVNKYHKVLGHTNLNCQRCGKEFRIRSLVRRHEKKCLNRITEPPSLNCSVCGKEFHKRSNCRRHERICAMKKERSPKE